MSSPNPLTNQSQSIPFDNRFIRELPADPETDNYCRQVTNSCYSRVNPAKVSNPQLVAYSHEVARLLDFTNEFCESDEFLQAFAGNKLLPGMEPYSICYGGFQFGNWAGQLGDGRVINLGEVVNAKGERWTLQLKGAGPTPYSRSADGLAVLRSSVREFLCSEAMHHLGVPTTRALSLITTGERVVRDMFYDGHPQKEPGAIVCRVAPSFTRFGNFEIFVAREDTESLRQLLDYTIKTDFPHLGEPSQAVYCKWFAEVCRTTSEMIIHWMRVGFVHGVMNTDNMSILGLTIDYGPYGWIEDYDPGWTPNTTDAQGRRYRFGNQPQIAMWNLARLANAIASLIDDVETLSETLRVYAEQFEEAWQTMMVAKLGLNEFDSKSDADLITELLEILKLVETDMTIFYRKLAMVKFDHDSSIEPQDEFLIAPLMDAYYSPDELIHDYRSRLVRWLRNYQARVIKQGISDLSRCQRMNEVNPKYVLRNYIAQLAIDKAEQGDHSTVNELLEVLRSPYDEQPDKEEYAKKRPEWARHRPGCSMLSCSS